MTSSQIKSTTKAMAELNINSKSISKLVPKPWSEPELKKWKYMYFGYLVKDEWLLKYGLRNNLRPPWLDEDDGEEKCEVYDEVTTIIFEATVDVLGKGKVATSSKIGSVRSSEGDLVRCLVLATNDPLDNLPPPEPERWAKLKEVLKTKEDPKWYLAVV